MRITKPKYRVQFVNEEARNEYRRLSEDYVLLKRAVHPDEAAIKAHNADCRALHALLK